MRRPALLLLFAAALSGLAPDLCGAGPAAPAPLRFKLTLTRPMLAPGNVKLEPGDYDVAFTPSPAGAPHFIAAFSRGGVPVAKAPAELKGATAGFKLSNVDKTGWVLGSFTNKGARKDGSINAATFDMKAEAERAFFEALLTEYNVPAVDASSKAPATIAFASPRSLPPTATPTPAKK